VLAGQLYVVGGMPAYEAPDAPHHRVSGSVMRYNPATNTWQTLRGEHQQGRHLHTQQQGQQHLHTWQQGTSF
jgi:N-acetylneuraminic acid mutarotase